MSDEQHGFSTESTDSSVRARIERTASGKIVKMLTADDRAATPMIEATIDAVVDGFAYFEGKVSAVLGE